MTELKHSRIGFARSLALCTVAGLVVGVAQGQNRGTNQGNSSGGTAQRPGDTAPPANEPPPATPAARDQTAPERNPPSGQDTGQKSTTGIQFDKEPGKGLHVSNVNPNSVAARAGLRANDRIVSIDGRAFANGRQADVYLSAQAGRQVPVIVDRNGQQFTVQIVPTEQQGEAPWIGVLLEEEDQSQGGTPAAPGQPGQRAAGTENKGARISQVYPAGPASRAGLRPGDNILQVNGQQIDGPADLIVAVHEMKPQSRAEFVVMRDAQQVKIPVTVGNRQESVQARFGGQMPEGQNGPVQAGAQQFDQFRPHAMQLEHDRRVAEQHQRIEEEIRQLREEVVKLREQIQRTNRTNITKEEIPPNTK